MQCREFSTSAAVRPVCTLIINLNLWIESPLLHKSLDVSPVNRACHGDSGAESRPRFACVATSWESSVRHCSTSRSLALVSSVTALMCSGFPEETMAKPPVTVTCTRSGANCVGDIDCNNNFMACWFLNHASDFTCPTMILDTKLGKDYYQDEVACN